MLFIRSLLGLDLPQPISHEQHMRDLRNLVTGIIARLSRGNVSLQNGHYILGEDIEVLRKNNQNHRFSS